LFTFAHSIKEDIRFFLASSDTAFKSVLIVEYERHLLPSRSLERALYPWNASVGSSRHHKIAHSRTILTYMTILKSYGRIRGEQGIQCWNQLWYKGSRDDMCELWQQGDNSLTWEKIFHSWIFLRFTSQVAKIKVLL